MLDQIRTDIRWALRRLRTSLGYAIGTTMLPAASSKIGTQFEVECRGEKIPAEVVKRPFYTQGSVKKGEQ